MPTAILDDRKTETRRVMKPQPTIETLIAESCEPGWHGYAPDQEQPEDISYTGTTWRCPYGVPGDRLWVRETWMPVYIPRAGREGICYKSDHAIHQCRHETSVWTMDRAGKWRSPIYMPRWASRITVEITNVAVERVQDISVEDVWAEGIDFRSCAFPTDKFHTHWDSLNAKKGHGWDENDWVWVLTFKRCNLQQGRRTK